MLEQSRQLNNPQNNHEINSGFNAVIESELIEWMFAGLSLMAGIAWRFLA